MGRTCPFPSFSLALQHLILTEYGCCHRIFRQADEIDSNDDDEGGSAQNRSSTDQYAYARLDRISVALIDSSRVLELLSFSSRDADLRMSVTTAKTRWAAAVGHVQIDQQSLGMNSKVPVILAPTPVKLPQPTVQFLAWKDNIRSKSDMDSFEYVCIQVSLSPYCSYGTYHLQVL